MSGILNVLLNLFFVIVFKMTVNGVAIATVLSNAFSSLLLLQKLMRTDRMIHVDLKALKIDRCSLMRILKIGLPAGIQSAVFAVANIIIQAAINSLGTVVIAASSAAYNIEIIAYDVFSSFSQACTTFVGQNFGAGQLKRCCSACWKTSSPPQQRSLSSWSPVMRYCPSSIVILTLSRSVIHGLSLSLPHIRSVCFMM